MDTWTPPGRRHLYCIYPRTFDLQQRDSVSLHGSKVYPVFGGLRKPGTLVWQHPSLCDMETLAMLPGGTTLGL